MKTTLFFSCSMIALSATPMAALAEEVSSSFSWGDVTFQPRVYAGYADYNLKSDDSFTRRFKDGSESKGPIVLYFSGENNSEVKNSKLQFSGLIGGIGGTVAYGQFFGDFYYQSTLNEEAQDPSFAELVSSNKKYNEFYSDVNAQHSDWAVSFGYLLTEQWSIFAGYKGGKTDWDQSYLGTNSSGSTLFDNSMNGTFKQDGPFIGTSYSFLVGPGALTFKAAYAYLDGTYDQTFIQRGFGEGYNDSSRTTKFDGNSNAYSLGVSWTHLLSDNLGYSVGANYHRYSFDLSSGQSEGTTNWQGDLVGINGSGTLTEDLFTLTAAITYRF